MRCARVLLAGVVRAAVPSLQAQHAAARQRSRDHGRRCEAISARITASEHQRPAVSGRKLPGEALLPRHVKYSFWSLLIFILTRGPQVSLARQPQPRNTGKVSMSHSCELHLRIYNVPRAGLIPRLTAGGGRF